ncbi:uncharacterized protein LOC130430367 [Triplophysa dalaica]|uniref:uncharacterized protein LOC130430367 n=1 Tax=Triplophysa dalaica TaxID=1582913 RepID=UPI0024DF9A10|nr:uncharacterized protein LOC130430367 [Triplophysa dalaica]
MLDVMLFCLCLWSLSGVFGTEFMQVIEGDCVTLPMNLTEHQRKQGISWKFGARGFLIAEITRGNGKVKTYEDQADGRFRDRLMLDQTGSLTIINITANDSGLYEVSNTSTNAKLKTFNINVHDQLPGSLTSGFCSCGFTEAAIRLVLSALVGVAVVAVMVSDIRYRKNGQKMGSDQKKKTEEDGIRTEEDGIRPEEDGIRPEEDGIRPEEDGIRPEEDGIRPEKDGIRTEEDQIRPEEDGIRPGDDGITPGEDGI